LVPLKTAFIVRWALAYTLPLWLGQFRSREASRSVWRVPSDWKVAPL
jgi:hypothetical protein